MRGSARAAARDLSPWTVSDRGDGGARLVHPVRSTRRLRRSQSEDVRMARLDGVARVDDERRCRDERLEVDAAMVRENGDTIERRERGGVERGRFQIVAA